MIDHILQRRASAPLGSSRLFTAGKNADIAAHFETYGRLPERGLDLAEELELSGLTGRGGAAFPVARKLRALAGRPGVLIANGSEGEPLSQKDRTLLLHAPHLVLDGLVALSRALGGAPRLIVVAPRDLTGHLRHAVIARDDAERFEISPIRHTRFVGGEASAVVRSLGGGDAVPVDHPEHLTTEGLKKKPTLLHNVETLAHIALIARFGAEWFRSVGDPADPGTRLISLSGEGVEPEVREVESGSTLLTMLVDAGVDVLSLSAVLVGGYHGEWHAPDELDLPVSNARDAAIRASAGVLRVLAKTECGLTESDAVVRYLADQTANQCGPCQFGLPAIADEFSALVAGTDDEDRRARLHGLLGQVPGRGACHHPDGSARFAISALRVFSVEAARHRQGTCTAKGLVR